VSRGIQRERGNSREFGCDTLECTRFECKFYENARNTPRTHRLARTIVILAAVSHALGSAVILLINRARLPVLVLALLIDGISVVGGYYFWTLTIWK